MAELQRADSVRIAQEVVLSILADNVDVGFSKDDIVEMVGESQDIVSEAMDKLENAKISVIKVIDGEYLYTGEKLEDLETNDDYYNPEVKEQKVSLKVESSEPSDSLYAKIANAFGRKRSMPEGSILKVVGCSKEELSKAGSEMEALGGISISFVEEYNERVFTKTKTTENFKNYQPSEEDLAEKAEAVIENKPVAEQVESTETDVEPSGPMSMSEVEQTTTVRKTARRGIVATDEANPYIDSMIMTVLEDKGLASKSGIGRAIEGPHEEHGKIGRPRVMARVDVLVEEGKVELVDHPAGERFKITGTEGVRKSSSKKTQAKVEDKKPAKVDAATAEVKAEDKKPVVDNKVETNVISKAKQSVSTKEASSSVEHVSIEMPAKSSAAHNLALVIAASQKTGAVDINSIVSAFNKMLSSDSKAEATAKELEMANEKIESLEAELEQWKRIGGMVVNEIAKI